MSTLIVRSVLWLVCALITYLVVRRSYRQWPGTWTQMDRFGWGIFCLLYGPIMLIVVILAGLAGKLGNTNWAKREARW